jgi:serine/threonine protein kinase
MEKMKEIINEVEVMKIEEERNRIVRMNEVYEKDKEMEILIELDEGGEMKKVIDDEEGMKEKYAARFMRKIIEGIS